MDLLNVKDISYNRRLGTDCLHVEANSAVLETNSATLGQIVYMWKQIAQHWKQKTRLETNSAALEHCVYSFIRTFW